MSTFADTSFLFAFYFPRSVSAQVIAKVDSLKDAVLISSLVRCEFQQAAWFEVWLKNTGQPRGLSETAAQSALAAFEIDVEQGLWSLAMPQWEGVIARAEKLALNYTPRIGARTMDILHLAAARELGVTEFLSFDENQRRVAEAEGMAVSI